MCGVVWCGVECVSVWVCEWCGVCVVVCGCVSVCGVCEWCGVCGVV